MRLACWIPIQNVVEWPDMRRGGPEKEERRRVRAQGSAQSAAVAGRCRTIRRLEKGLRHRLCNRWEVKLERGGDADQEMQGLKPLKADWLAVQEAKVAA